MEPFMRIHKEFLVSSISTTISGALGTTIATLSRVHGKFARASHVAPPKVLANMIDGLPVDTSGMPPLVTKFLDAREPDSDKSRRAELFAMWLKNYHIDASKKKNLCGIADKKRASIGLLNSRILLLWSLHTFVQDFDRSLLSLLKVVKDPGSDNPDLVSTSANRDAKYASGADEVAVLLKLQPQIDELKRLRRDNVESTRRDELELLVLESTLLGALEVQVASDRVDEELNYNYHIVLAQLLQSRAKWLQFTYDLNFIQSGIMGTIAGKLYLEKHSFAGSNQFVIAGGIGTGLTTLAMLENHGFWRRSTTGPNGLAEVLNLHPANQYRFSPFVSSFLNDPPPGSTDTRTRRELLNDAWEKRHVSAVRLNKTKNVEALANMPTHKFDTIKLVTNRIKLLHSLKKELESFHVEVLDLLRATD